jgi:nucleoside-diphosphate-sugar epimerase
LILVTGGAGRLGFEVTKLLLARGKEVAIFDLSNVDWSRIEKLGVRAIKGDITRGEEVIDACEDCDAVVHLAALLPPKSERDEALTMSVNVNGTANLLEAIDRSVPFVFASSVSIYGITSRETALLGENHQCHSHDHYSRSKIIGEEMVANSGNPYTILRISPITLADVVELPAVIPYRGDQRVEFIFIEDAARAIVGALDRVQGETLNVAGGSTWQMLGAQYIQRFYAALGVEVEPNYSDEYTAVDWYDTRRSGVLDYQKTSFMEVEERLKVVGKEYGLR